MKPLFGLDVVVSSTPSGLRRKRVGLVCHAASISSTYAHAVDVMNAADGLTLTAIFGPQHGLFGQTQDNMVEWEGTLHPQLKIPVFSLYGSSRKPTPAMLEHVDVLVIDLQDVGARPYTYVWTVKLCMEACAERGIPVWVLDRPNPIAALDFDGPMLRPDFFTFVGGAEIPLCHRMTMGEMAMMLKNAYFPRADVHVVWMENWWRDSLWNETGLPWVLPSPNLPTLDGAIVYPGMVLLEATNLSEGRGTTRPFELLGAPFVDAARVKDAVAGAGVAGCLIREHGFIPTFQKWRGEYCVGLQVHVTEPRVYRPVLATSVILGSIIEAAPDKFQFKQPPYEYETVKMPFDILSGDTELRLTLERRESLPALSEKWRADRAGFLTDFASIAHYPEKQP